MGKAPSWNVICVWHDGLGQSGKTTYFVIPRLDRACPALVEDPEAAGGTGFNGGDDFFETVERGSPDAV